jgi:hypothetical protein
VTIRTPPKVGCNLNDIADYWRNKGWFRAISMNNVPVAAAVVLPEISAIDASRL